ncbi:TSUP family transporter [Pikeienuella sp. HZG-20]|uniref:TSUP family transporter n=1 Tax=Paludibacillus litoralis TaxID=3133267 RepID=UPI0030EF6E55
MIETFGVSLASAAVFGAIVTISAALHRLGGQGFGTVLAPFAALIAPYHTPATVLLLGSLVTLTGAGLELRAIRVREIAPALVGRLLGTLPAVWLVGIVVGSRYLGLSVAAVILLGVGLSLAGLRVRKTPLMLMAAGGLSGFIGTLTSVGAAPMALIYQHDEARKARATLNTFFMFGVAGSFAALAIAGLVEVRHVRFAAAMAPMALLGIWLAGPLARRVGGMSLKPIGLSLATLGALLLIWRNAW